MKKIILILTLLLCTLFINGCTKTTNDNYHKANDKPVGINYDAFKYSYEANLDNIEKFYKFASYYKGLDKGYQFSVNLIPKMYLAAKNLKITVEYKIICKRFANKPSDTFTHTFYLESSSIDMISDIAIDEKLLFEPIEYEVLPYNILSVSGMVYTNTEIIGEKAFVKDEVANKLNYDKFKTAMSNFENNNESNYYSVSTSITNKYTKDNLSTSDSQTSLIKMISSPFYLETQISNEHTVIQEESGKLFSYEIINIDLINRQFIGDINDIDNLIDLEGLLGSSQVKTKDIDYKLILIENTNNTYVLSGYYRDLLPTETYKEMQALFKKLGYKDLVLKDATFILTFTFLEDGLVFDTIINLPINNNQYDTIETTTNIAISLKEFSKINLGDSSK